MSSLLSRPSAETIFAVATGAAQGAITVIRLSGDRSADILEKLCGDLPPPRHASLRALQSRTGEILDKALVLWFPAPGSYTGEPSVELHLHGGRAVSAAVSARLAELGASLAAAGDFTRRAFLNGKMDLLEAEGIADLVHAETEAQRKQALRQMQGALSAIYHGWATQLRRLLAFQEALIDFPDEDLPEAADRELREGLQSLQQALAVHLADCWRGERVRDGLLVAIVGVPNAGKSSLLNALADRDVAITSSIPGTTRDTLEVRLDCGGLAVTLVDTAGLRESADLIEAEGVRRARARASDADLVIELIDAADPQFATIDAAQLLRVANKIDLNAAPEGYLGISVATGVGLLELRHELTERLTQLVAGAGAPFTRERHRAALEATLHFLQRAEDAAYPELRGEDLRQALQALGALTGEVGVEAILDTVFSSFCIGK